jgi:ubiquitin-conjugating enzyme E2 variant
MAVEREQHKDAGELEAGYTRGHRIYELCGMVGCVASSLWLLVRVLESRPFSGWWVPLAALVGMLAADFVSGLFHWGFDTWGKVDTPVVGRLAIRTFRHHHVDAKAITRHDYIETNGHNYGLAFPVALGVAIGLDPATATLLHVFVGMSTLSLVVFVCMTSQIHKWAHQDSPSRFVVFLQRWRLIITPEHHSVHHIAPYLRNYCITVGWMNGPLHAVRFFETLERVISAVTGAVPREDDLGSDEALEIAAEQEREIASDSTAPAPVTARD